jgi:death-on-curing protein
MKYISLEYMLKLHEKLIKATGRSIEIRYIELLKSSIENSKVTFNGEELYPTSENKSANICYSIIIYKKHSVNIFCYCRKANMKVLELT